METPALANDKYRAVLRSTWIADPADVTLLVTAIPTNVPTIVVVGWETIYETVFRVEGVSGDNSSNYALTGVTRLKGANVNLPEGTAVNCLNNEEYFNQWGTLIAAVQETADAAQDLVDSIDASGVTLLLGKALADKVATLTDGATVDIDASLGNSFYLSASGDRTLNIPTNPPASGFTQKILIFHKATGAERTLSLTVTGDNCFAFGSDVTEIAPTASGKTDIIAAVWNGTLAKWVVVAQVQGF